MLRSRAHRGGVVSPASCIGPADDHQLDDHDDTATHCGDETPCHDDNSTPSYDDDSTPSYDDDSPTSLHHDDDCELHLDYQHHCCCRWSRAVQSLCQPGGIQRHADRCCPGRRHHSHDCDVRRNDDHHDRAGFEHERGVIHVRELDESAARAALQATLASLNHSKAQVQVNEQVDLAYSPTIFAATAPGVAANGTLQTLFISMVIGLFIGTIIAFILASSRRRFETATDPQKVYGVPLMTTVPAFEAMVWSAATLPVLTAPTDEAAESYRILATLLRARPAIRTAWSLHSVRLI